MIEVPIQFYLGETFQPPPVLFQQEVNGVWVSVNLTGYTATFTARNTINSVDPPYILATTQDGYIVINGTAGSIQLTLPSTYTQQLQVPFQGFWDLWVYSPAYTPVATRLVGGIINVLQPITRP